MCICVLICVLIYDVQLSILRNVAEAVALYTRVVEMDKSNVLASANLAMVLLTYADVC
jgi:hypothetical protein